MKKKKKNCCPFSEANLSYISISCSHEVKVKVSLLKIKEQFIIKEHNVWEELIFIFYQFYFIAFSA